MPTETVILAHPVLLGWITEFWIDISPGWPTHGVGGKFKFQVEHQQFCYEMFT